MKSVLTLLTFLAWVVFLVVVSQENSQLREENQELRKDAASSSEAAGRWLNIADMLVELDQLANKE